MEYKNLEEARTRVLNKIIEINAGIKEATAKEESDFLEEQKTTAYEVLAQIDAILHNIKSLQLRLDNQKH